jgi:hypothetical protein
VSADLLREPRERRIDDRVLADTLALSAFFASLPLRPSPSDDLACDGTVGIAPARRAEIVRASTAETGWPLFRRSCD